MCEQSTLRKENRLLSSLSPYLLSLAVASGIAHLTSPNRIFGLFDIFHLSASHQQILDCIFEQFTHTGQAKFSEH